MKKVMKRVVASVLSLAIAMSVSVMPALAETHETQDSATMTPVVRVYEIGDEAYYQANADGSIEYADRDIEGYSFKAVPSAYILGSEYNKDNVAYGMYVTTAKDAEGNDVAKVHVVPLEDCIVDNGMYYYDHGTADSATVSVEVDTADNYDPTMSTQFYLNIENGIDPDGVTTEEVVGNNGTADARVNYEITVAQKATFQINATVPLYVCMYGYRGTGNIVTPDATAYQLKNYSTQNANTEAWITEIVKLTQFTQILDEDHSDEEIYSIAYKEGEGYTWWYSDPSDGNGFDANYYDAYTKISNLSPAVDEVNASGQVYVIYEAMGDTWSFCPAGQLVDGVLYESVDSIDPRYVLSNDFIYNGWNFGTSFAVDATGTFEGTSSVEGMALRVTELQAEPATWRVVPMATEPSELLRGQLVMSIAPDAANAMYDASAIDLADCSAPLDITEKGWFMAAPEVGTDGKVAADKATVLPLNVKAQMAGSNVNAAGCTPVVKVTYTVTPVFNSSDVLVVGQETT